MRTSRSNVEVVAWRSPRCPSLLPGAHAVDAGKHVAGPRHLTPVISRSGSSAATTSLKLAMLRRMSTTAHGDSACCADHVGEERCHNNSAETGDNPRLLQAPCRLDEGSEVDGPADAEHGGDEDAMIGAVPEALTNSCQRRRPEVVWNHARHPAMPRAFPRRFYSAPWPAQRPE